MIMNAESLNFTLRQLKAFSSVARTRSFVAASRELFVTPSALSDTVRQLEEALGTRLFDRTTRRVEITDAGRQFLTDVSQALEILESSARRMGDLGSGASGTVSVIGAASVQARVTSPCVADLTRSHPGIRFSIFEDGTSGIVASVLQGRASFGVGVMPDEAEGALHSVPLIDDLYGVVALKGHEIFSLQTLSPEDLYSFQYVSFINSSIAADVFRGPERPRIEVDGFGSMTCLLKQGVGVSILPALAARSFLDHELEFRPFKEPSRVRHVSIIRRRDRPLSPAATLLWDKMLRMAKSIVPQGEVFTGNAPRP